MHYFAYGSNMSHRRLQARVSSAQKVDVGLLSHHQLCFHKIGQDGSAKCDAFETGVAQHVIYGVVYRIDPEHKPMLDSAEGLGNGYEIKEVLVSMENGEETTAFTYYATHLNPALKPMDWYKQHVIRGALENNLPVSYRRIIEEVVCIDDEDLLRRDHELSIYR
jgi:gamma-glutamylcyclotransferase (GGCT)/AIG2-like uncharacterized protein YtfP